jgi:tetratricopeptide (TPR) repeat protein
LSLDALKQHRNEILQEAATLEQHGGGLLLVPYSESQEASVLLLLTLLIGRLVREKKPVQLYRAPLEPFPPGDLPMSGYLLVHNLPLMDGLLDQFTYGPVALSSRPVVVATGTREELQQLRIALPHAFHRALEPLEEATAEFEQAKTSERQAYRQLGRDARAYFLVALFDAWGIPLPFSLLARALNADEDEVGLLVEKAHTMGLLYWIELEKPPALLVSTKAPSLARTMVDLIVREGPAGTEVLEEYATVIKAVDPGEKEERYTALKLFQALLRGSHRWGAVQESWRIQGPRRKWLLELIRRTEETLEGIWQQGDTTEHLLWGKLFEELRDFERSDRLFSQGLNQDPRNPFLLHARAKLLGDWARLDRIRLQAAEDAFREAAQRMPENPYIWQAWGVMEAELDRAGEARRHFDQALRAARAARRERDTLYTLIAWADLEIEAGEYPTANRLLGEVERLAPQSPYGLHLRGKKAFYEGKYREAEAALRGVLAIDPVNVPGLNTLGVMALKRGHWAKAERFFLQALAIHPENIPTLHALGELWAERGDLAAAEEGRDEALACYRKAEERFRQIIEWESRNLYALVALGRLSTKWTSLEPERAGEAERQLQEALRLHPANKFALHALGELRRQQGKLKEAEGYFTEALRSHRDNLPALLSLAELYLMQDRQPEAQQILSSVGPIIAAVERGERSLPCHDLIKADNTWARVELQAQRRDQALAHIEKALEYDRENAYTHRTYAKILEALGRLEEARTHREQARTLGMVVDEAEME